jgi:hypothetical protein
MLTLVNCVQVFEMLARQYAAKHRTMKEVTRQLPSGFDCSI